MDTQLPVPLSFRDEGDECFEMVEYIASSQKENLITTIEETLRKWFILSETSPASSSSLIDLVGTCFELEYLRFEDTDTFAKHPFPCQSFCYNEKIEFFSSDPKKQLHRWTGLSELLILQPSPTTSFVQPEMAKALLTVGRTAFRRAGLSHLPLLVPYGPPLKRQYEGALAPLFLKSALIFKQDIDSHNSTSTPSPCSSPRIHSEAAMFITEHNLPCSDSLDIKRAAEWFKDIIKSQFRDHSLDENFLYISAEYHYTLTSSPDQKWNATKVSYSKKVPTPPGKRTSGYSMFKGLGLAGSLEEIIQGCANLGNSNELSQLEILWGPSCNPLRSLELSLQFPQSSIDFELEHDPNAATHFCLGANFSALNSEWALLSEMIRSNLNTWTEEDNNFVFPLEVEDNSYHDSPLFDGMPLQSNSNWGKDIHPDLNSMILNALFSSPSASRDHKTPPTSLATNFLTPAAVPRQSFIWQFVVFILATTSNNNRLTLRSLLRSLWTEIVRRLRWHWESCTLIPNLNPASSKEEIEVDLRFGLLHQKLSMINYCIDRQVQLPSKLPPRPKTKSNGSSFPDSLSSKRTSLSQGQAKFSSSNSLNGSMSRVDIPPTLEEQGLFGSVSKPLPCMAHNELQGSPELLSPPSSSPSDGFARSANILLSPNTRPCQPAPSSGQSLLRGHDHSLAGESFVQLVCPSSIDSYTSILEVPGPVSDSGEGRLKVLEDYRLLQHDVPLYIPVTQNPGVMTEDMLRDQAQLFERLGNSSQATKRRAQLQGAQLLSDMEAFKAANPLSSLGDFVRWYSPRDWAPSSDPNGQLSTRMENPDNVWQELWLKATPVPAHLQKPLFDSITEGEKALHFLENLPVYELYHLLLPTILLVAHDVLSQALPTEELLVIKSALDALGRQITMFPWSVPENDVNELALLIDQLRDTELLLGRAVSLLKKFPERIELVDRLVSFHGTHVVDKCERDDVIRLFSTKSSRYVPPLARYEPTLSTPSSSFIAPRRQEFVCETHSLTQEPTPTMSGSWYRVYFDYCHSVVRTSIMALPDPDKFVNRE